MSECGLLSGDDSCNTAMHLAFLGTRIRTRSVCRMADDRRTSITPEQHPEETVGIELTPCHFCWTDGRDPLLQLINPSKSDAVAAMISNESIVSVVVRHPLLIVGGFYFSVG